MSQWSIKPVCQQNWSDFEDFFMARGAPHYCWCMAWRPSCKELESTVLNAKKACIESYVNQGIPIGLLAYINGDPVGWCFLAPRSSFRNLRGDDTLEDVWSIVCFYFSRSHRGIGLTHRFITFAKSYAKRHGAKYLEAYPVAKDSPSYRFMGYISTFKEAGFTLVKAAGSRRNVMVYDLQTDEASTTSKSS